MDILPLPDVASDAARMHLRWSLTPEIGPILFGRLIERFGSAGEALGAGVVRLQEVAGIGRASAERIARGRDEADIDAEFALAARHGVRILCREDAAFPEPLRHIPDPPICLYVRGELRRTDTLAIGIVGARRCTLYGHEQAYRFAYQLAARGMTIVSGLARGADSEAHKGALAADGRTLAVLGNGLARIYPPEHRELADRITRDGALISELPMATAPDRTNFLPRNRLIAGLSLGILVVEAARRSGSLSTAARANDYDREVFAVPGRVDSDYSTGTNALIRDQHAKLVMSADDILDELGEAGAILKEEDEREPRAAAAASVSLNDDERAIWEVMNKDGRSIEVLADGTGRSAARVASTLVTLQLKGLVRQLPGGLFVRVERRR